MKIVVTADLHGQLPTIPKCDLLLIAGDVCPVWDHKIPFQQWWLEHAFADWLHQQPARKVIAVWGNHDWIGEKYAQYVRDVPWTMLTDEMTEFEGLRIYGLPWQRRFNDWAFNLDESDLDRKYEAIPECDIIVSHGPPYGYGDYVSRDMVGVGSKAFLKRIDEIKPKLVAFGHIHCDPGVWSRNGTILVNATYINEQYEAQYRPTVVEI